MNAPMEAAVIKQHLIDPEICIRCNTCESICPVQAITHDSRNYVVDVSKCNWCNDCISPCPTGSIDNYRRVVRARAYSVEEQLGWDVLPAEIPSADLAAAAARLLTSRYSATGSASARSQSRNARANCCPGHPSTRRCTFAGLPGSAEACRRLRHSVGSASPGTPNGGFGSSSGTFSRRGNPMARNGSASASAVSRSGTVI